MTDPQSWVAPTCHRLADLLAADVDAWGAPSLCAGWRVRHVVAHVTMPARLLAGTAAWWEPVLSLALTLAAAAALIAIAGRIYRRSLLQTGGRLSLRQALRVQE